MDQNTTLEHRDDFGDKLGMWIFIFTELILFAGLFLVYAVFRAKYNEDFHIASHQLNVFLGAFNTLILLVSSMTMAMAITAVQKNNKQLALRLLYITLFLAIAFLVNKYFEWGGKISHQLYPGSDVVMNLKNGQALYFGLYYIMTGLHAIHIIIGVVLIGIIAKKVKSGSINSTDYVTLENGGLYWHLVDLIWIFLFPLLYLIA
jgi:cytochrome c oxidase subunit 3